MIEIVQLNELHDGRVQSTNECTKDINYKEPSPQLSWKGGQDIHDDRFALVI